ncbi:MAG: Lrp/AsnC family transcriptional regulator [Nanoarchaeota archaeon]
MDRKDRRILFELDRNARISFHALAKKTKIPEETVRYRVNKLEQEGIIRKFLAIINSRQLGYSYYQVLFKLQNVDQHKKSEFIKQLMADHRTGWVTELEGMFDIGMIVLVKNQLELHSLVDALYAKFAPNIMRRSISIHLTGTFLPRDYLIDKTRMKSVQPSYHPAEKELVIDETDERICTLLSDNSRLSATEIAKKIRCSTDTVINHMRKLIKQHVLLAHTILLDNEKVNQLHYKVLVYLNNSSIGRINALQAHAAMNNRAIAIIRTLAAWDFEIDLEIENMSQLREFTMSLTSQFSDIVRDYETVRIIEMPKYTFFPEKK